MQTKETHTGRTYRWKDEIDGELDAVDSVIVIDSLTGDEETHTLDRTPSDISVANNPDGNGFSAFVDYPGSQNKFWAEAEKVLITYEDGTEELLFELEE